MRNALVIHTSLSGLGGAEKVSSAIIESLKKMNYYVKLYTMEPTNWKQLINVFNIEPKTLPHEYYNLLPFHIRKFTIYTRLIASKIMESKIKRGYDIVINTHGDALPIATDIVYMHFPGFAAMEYYPHKHRSTGSIINKIYLAGYDFLRRHLTPSFENSTILCNSSFSRAVIKLKLNIDAQVVYPPIDIEFFGKAYFRKKGSEPYNIVSIGRFSPEKNYEFIVEIAKRLRDLKFFIIGSIGNPKNKSYFLKILGLKHKYSLSNLILVPNASHRKLLEILTYSRVLLHTMKYEHFGMAIAEGMVAGLVPVIHRSGGAYYDIIKRDKYGYSYRTIDEAIEKIWEALENYPRIYGKIHDYASKEFGREEFHIRFKKILDSITNQDIIV
ncbi:glycosyltransferase [Staphylothermus hellenicus]|uniref:Glycosyl transferase group 1 n=1 Tax=Staphylothermus hellenicus (strain DSM 12710 / JCM 10830 / BK20S6-10-b1 / P8) TaxID=591019 RepID=D7DA08_STAHD|nr:glycosyltransferase [Staphylothermus hellenicus]ADI32604.1 glycosyl transferase group 1 [Staphylothermus hellenicus DSM 12710]